MDLLTAWSLAGTVVQSVDFGSKVLNNDSGLYKSLTGLLTANEETELIAADFRFLTTKLGQSLSTDISGASTRAIMKTSQLLRRYEAMLPP
jgi:hypothetical protein